MGTIITHAKHDHFTSNGEHIISTEVSASRIAHWLKQGWIDMANAPVASLFYGAATTLFVLLTLAAFRDSPFLMFTVATSFVMIAPFLATGLYAIAQNVEKHEYPDLNRSLLAWQSNTTNFALYALALGIIIAIWSRITPLIAAVVKSQSLVIVNPEMGIMGFLLSEAGIQFLIAFSLIGAVLGAFVFAISVVTIPLLLQDNKVDALNAMIVSFQVTMENKGTMALWALTIGILFSLGVVTGGLLMIVVMPLLGYASWHAYKELVSVEPQPN
jgi:uncharacterized membrane protein